MNAIVCACGRRFESDKAGWSKDWIEMLRTRDHDPDECSRQAGYQGRFEGRREMALSAVAHLAARGTLGGAEIAEIRTNLLDMVTSLPLGKVAAPPGG